MLPGPDNTILEQILNNVPVAEIQQSLQLDISLLHFAMLNDLDDVRDALVACGIDLNETNVLGETIVHHAAQMGAMKSMLKVIEWANRGLVNFSAKTHIHSNFFHFIPLIEDKAWIDTLLTMATPELLLDKNQLGLSPLSIIIQADNAIFLQAVLQRFPQLIAVEQGWGCLKMHYDTLLHDIARSGAEKCFNVVRSCFSENEWIELNHYRNAEDSLPIETAALSNQNKMFQMFKGYRSPQGIPTLAWLSAIQAAKNNICSVNRLTDEIVDAAKAAVRQQELDEQPLSDADMPDEGCGEWASALPRTYLR